MPLVTREGKGSKLTIAEMDGNLEYLESLAPQTTTTTVNISSAQIKAIVTSPILALTGIGANQYPLIHSVIFESNNSGGTPYTVAGDEYIVLYSDNYNAIYTVPDHLLSNTKSVAVRTQVDLEYNTQANTYMTVGEDWYISIFGAAQSLGTNPTLGTGTMRVIITYTTKTFGS